MSEFSSVLVHMNPSLSKKHLKLNNCESMKRSIFVILETMTGCEQTQWTRLTPGVRSRACHGAETLAESIDQAGVHVINKMAK